MMRLLAERARLTVFVNPTLQHSMGGGTCGPGSRLLRPRFGKAGQALGRQRGGGVPLLRGRALRWMTTQFVPLATLHRKADFGALPWRALSDAPRNWFTVAVADLDGIAVNLPSTIHVAPVETDSVVPVGPFPPSH